MIKCIADEIRVDVWGDLAKSPIVALLTDESTSLSQVKRLIVYFICILNAETAPEACIKFIDICNVNGADAEGMLGVIETLLIRINRFLSDNINGYDDDKWKRSK